MPPAPPEVPLRRLPAPPTPLVGRDDDLARARTHLLAGEGRLLTLTGPAGVGKTRLALAVAATIGHPFDAVAWIDLAPIAVPAAVLPEVADGLGLRGVPADRLLAAAADHLRGRRQLVVLDNLEHLLPVASDVEQLLASCPRLAVLATSREPLRLRREQILPVPPLALPPRLIGRVDDRALAGLVENPAVALFVRRARMVFPGFALSAENAGAVAELVSRLDGLPLAIELAASRSNVLDPAGILARLDHRLALLRWEASDLPARQRTLEAAVAWSYDLLPAEEQSVFRRLAVFAGGWTAAAAVVVDPDRPEPERFETLSSLVTKNLVVVEPSAASGEGRFSFLETVRAFALAELAAAGEVAAFRRRHLAYVLSLAERAVPELQGPRQAAWLDRLEREHDNVRAALAFAAADDLLTCLRLATALRRFWYARGSLEDGLSRMTDALAAAPAAPTGLRAQAMAGAGCLAVWCGDFARAAALCEAALPLARQVAADYPAALALTQLAAVARFSGELGRAAALLADAALHYERCGSVAGLALTVRNEGSIARLRGDHPAAATLMTDALARYRAIGHQREIANTLTLLAEVEAEQSGPAAAGALLDEALGVCGELGHAGTIAFTADVVARLGVAIVAPQRLGRLLGGADTLRTASGFARTPAERAGRERVAAVVQTALGEPGRAAAEDAGATLTAADVVAEARAAVAEFRRSPDAPTAANGHRSAALSPRELAVLRLVAEGRSNKEIGVALFVSENTAKFHVTSILNKLGAGTRAQAAALAAHRGLL